MQKNDNKLTIKFKILTAKVSAGATVFFHLNKESDTFSDN